MHKLKKIFQSKQFLIIAFSCIILAFGLFIKINNVSAVSAWDVYDYLTMDQSFEKKGTDHGIIYTLMSIVTRIFLAFASCGAWLLKHVVYNLFFNPVFELVESFFTPTYYKNIGFINNAVVQYGHRVIANIANFLFIIALIFIAVGTLFRIERYNFKKLLIKLIIVAFLSNFSLVFAGNILDFTHVLMFSMTNDNPAKLLHLKTDAFIQQLDAKFFELNHIFFNIVWADELNVAIENAAPLILAVLFIVCIALSVLALAIFMIIRVVALWLLLVLSPFGLIGLILPDTEGLAKKWWSSFLKYAFMGPLMMFFLFLAGKFISDVNITPNPTANNSNNFTSYAVINDSNQLKTFINNANAGTGVLVPSTIGGRETMLFMLLVLALLWGAIISSASLGIVGASVVIGAAKGAMVLTGGALASGFVAKGAISAGRWADTGRQKKKYDDQKRSLQNDLSLLRSSGANPADIEAKEKELAQAGASYDAVKERDKKWSMVSAMTSPLALYRAWRVKSKTEGDINAQEDREMFFGNTKMAWDSLPFTGPGMKSRIAFEKELAEKNAKVQLEQAKQKWTELEKSDPEIKELTTQLGNLESDDPRYAHLMQAIEKLKIKKTGVGGDPNDKSTQDAFIQTSRNQVSQQRWDKILNREREEARDVEIQMQSLIGVYKVDELVARLNVAKSEGEREAILRKAWGQGDASELLVKMGFKSNEEQKLVQNLFSTIRAGRVMNDLDNIAKQSGDIAHTGNLQYDNGLKRTRFSTEEEKQNNINRVFAGKSPMALANQARPDFILTENADGTKELASSFKNFISQFNQKFLQYGSKDLSPKVIGALKEIRDKTQKSPNGKLLFNNKPEQEISQVHLDSIKAVINRWEGRRSGSSGGTS